MVDKTYGTGVAHLRTEKSITDSGDATEYPNSQVIISGEDYVIMRISNGVEWFSLGIGPSNRMPSASIFGKGSWKSDVIYLSDGVSYSANSSIESIKVVDSIEELATIPSTYTTAIVKDSLQGDIFDWSATGTVDNATVYVGVTGYWVRTGYSTISSNWFGLVGDGVANDTTALFNFLTKAISYGSGHLESGTYLVTEGVLAFDNNHIDTAFPDITTGSNVIIKSAGTNDLPLLAFTNGTAVGPSGKFWMGGSLGDIEFLDATGHVAPNRHGLLLRGIWYTKFGVIKGSSLRGDVVHIEKKLYSTTNPDPYSVTACEFQNVIGYFTVGWTFNNDNYVGFNFCTIKILRCVQSILGCFRGLGSVNNINHISIATTSGWSIYDVDDNLGGSPSRIYIGSCEFDNVANGIKLNKISQIVADEGIRFVHRYNANPNVSNTYWPRNAVLMASEALPTISNVKLNIVHRIESGGVLADLGNIVNFSSSSNIIDVEVNNRIQDNAALGITDASIFTNVSASMVGVVGYIDKRKILDTLIRQGCELSMDSTVSISNTGFGTATAKVPYISERYDKGGYADPTNNWFTVPISGVYQIHVALTLAVAIGTRVRVAIYRDRAGTLAALGSPPLNGGLFSIINRLLPSYA